MKRISFQVTNGRIHFKCSNCQAKRMISVPTGVRQRSLRCHRCGEITRCSFNRRYTGRERQSGKVLLYTGDGSQFEIDLYDISQRGVGFELHAKDIRRVAVGREVSFRCPWNPLLLSQGRYRIKSISGRRVGAEKV